MCGAIHFFDILVLNILNWQEIRKEKKKKHEMEQKWILKLAFSQVYWFAFKICFTYQAPDNVISQIIYSVFGSLSKSCFLRMASLNGNGSSDNVIIQLMVSVFLCLKVMAGYEDLEKNTSPQKHKWADSTVQWNSVITNLMGPSKCVHNKRGLL